jgi:Mrp family chromosome partitioning ATPase
MSSNDQSSLSANEPKAGKDNPAVESAAVNDSHEQAADMERVRFDKKLVVIDSPDSKKARALTQLRMRLAIAAQKKAICFASERSGDGKTYLACNVAASFAQAEQRTLIVDTNFLSPGIEQLLPLKKGFTLIEALEQPELDLAQVPRAKGLPRLFALPAGKHSAKANDILVNADLEAFFHRAMKVFDVIIIDTPALDQMNTVPDAIAKFCQQVLLVVAKNRATPAATDSLKRRLGAHAVVLGAVLSQR